MKPKTAKILQILIGVLGAMQVTLGILFWTLVLVPTGPLLPVHMLLGLIIVILLWVASGVAWKAGLGWKRVAGGVVLGVVTIAWAFIHVDFFGTGAMEQVARALHLVIGLGALGFSQMLLKKSVSVTGQVTAALR